MQRILVGLILFLVLFFVFRRLLRVFFGKSACNCSGCTLEDTSCPEQCITQCQEKNQEQSITGPEGEENRKEPN